jgi:hypothetical protein
MTAWDVIKMGLKLAVGLDKDLREAQAEKDGKRIEKAHARALALDAKIRRMEKEDPELARILAKARAEGRVR